MIIVADTSALFAAFDAAQPEHEASARIVAEETLAISPLVVTELDHIVQRHLGFPASLRTMEAVNERLTDGQYKLATLHPVDLVAAHEVRQKYEGLRLDLADAVGVVLADRYRTDRILSLDQRDFRAITPLTKGFSAFRVLPFDH
ncbi:PIN domain-containing protein [Streptomyces sp. NPDC093795]|uniref:PIN domain-containing protein n=1 Tax=Streptomyces sp. NPDC093795 TaxID=3366051 RepID=UPI00381E7A63